MLFLQVETLMESGFENKTQRDHQNYENESINLQIIWSSIFWDNFQLTVLRFELSTNRWRNQQALIVMEFEYELLMCHE